MSLEIITLTISIITPIFYFLAEIRFMKGLSLRSQKNRAVQA